MASIKQARVIQWEKWQEDVCHVLCEMIEPKELGFKGGQYIIVNSGEILPNGKLGKRAYSILSLDSEQHYFELAVKRISQGVGSGFMHELKVGDVFEFSGPWGKYQIAPGNQEQRVLCIATDTGITAALGLSRGEALKPFLEESKLIWIVSSLDYFIPVPRVQSWLPQSLFFQWVLPVPVVGDESRMESSAAATKFPGISSGTSARGASPPSASRPLVGTEHPPIVGEQVPPHPLSALAEYKTKESCKGTIEEKTAQILGDQIFTKIYLSGDGQVLRKLKDGFLMSGDYQEDQIVVESFFHHESLKSLAV